MVYLMQVYLSWGYGRIGYHSNLTYQIVVGRCISRVYSGDYWTFICSLKMVYVYYIHIRFSSQLSEIELYDSMLIYSLSSVFIENLTQEVFLLQ